LRSADDLLDEKRKSLLFAITESGELLPVCAKLMTLLDEKKKIRLPAITESGELLRVCGQLMTYLMKKRKSGSLLSLKAGSFFLCAVS
jgi:hypothetical protein